MNNVPAIQTPQMEDPMNTAFKMLQMKNAMDQSKNAAALGRIKIEEADNEKKLEASNFTLNLLSGVENDNDLAIAKRILLSRYPLGSENINKSLPNKFDPDEIRMFTGALRDMNNKLENKKFEYSKVKPEGFSAGTAIFKGGEQVGQVPFKKEFDIFEDEEGNQFYVEEGQKIPSGLTKVQTKGTSVNINTGDLGKTTKTSLEKDIIEGTKNIQSFYETGKLFKPEYLTYMGKGKKELAEVMDKAGVPSEGQKEYLNEYQSWFRRAKADFIAYRKWATGVAGGEKEMAEIATSFPDPVKNSPEQYKSNLESIDETTKQILMLNVDFLRSGIDVDQPLDKVLIQAKEAGIDIPDEMIKKISDKNTVIRFDKDGNVVP